MFPFADEPVRVMHSPDADRTIKKSVLVRRTPELQV